MESREYLIAVESKYIRKTAEAADLLLIFLLNYSKRD